MKKCPFCAEEIQSEAIICKHCNTDLRKMDFKDNPLKALARSMIMKKVDGELFGKRFPYKISLHKCKYSWHQNKKVMQGMTSESNYAEGGTGFEYWLTCPELGSIFTIKIEEIPQGWTVENALMAVFNQQVSDFEDGTTTDFETKDVDNSNPFVSGKLLRCRGNLKNSSNRSEIAVIVLFHQSVAFMLRLIAPEHLREYAKEELLQIFSTFEWTHSFLPEEGARATNSHIPWSDYEKSAEYLNCREVERGILKTAYFRVYNANGTPKK